ncbi:hypothetical protein TNIN_150991 [Trichonephila inaurata madagascariensis]|uniref:Uncharacterized protein n=1 Tax=Trichonephila inaurata madagascariensis TaxID=2747483 RepID=A0A8X6Y282_9ARAC|nr:hypothetical protein TNIN_150991 [Trichonephila inaurata madagascariensis]
MIFHSLSPSPHSSLKGGKSKQSLDMRQKKSRSDSKPAETDGSFLGRKQRRVNQRDLAAFLPFIQNLSQMLIFEIEADYWKVQGGGQPTPLSVW